MLGRFLEVSVHAPAILESVAFWEALGFRQLPTNDAWSHPYALLTDGRAFIGLHAREHDSPRLSFVRMDLAGHLSMLRQAGIEFDYARTGDDHFNEAGFRCPDGCPVALLESRTFSPPTFEDTDFSLLGTLQDFALPVRDIGRSLPFWAKLGLAVLDYEEGPVAEATLSEGGFRLRLSEDSALRAPALVFQGDGEYAATLIEQRTGLQGKLRGGALQLVTPEGLHLIVGPRP